MNSLNFLFLYVGSILADESLRKRLEMRQQLLWLSGRKIHGIKKDCMEGKAAVPVSFILLDKELTGRRGQTLTIAWGGH